MLTSRMGSLIGRVCQLHRNYELLWNILPFESPLIIFCCCGNHICWEQINWIFVGREIQLCWVFYEYSHAAPSKVWNPEVESESGKIQRNANKPTNHKGRYKHRVNTACQLVVNGVKQGFGFIIWQNRGVYFDPWNIKEIVLASNNANGIGMLLQRKFSTNKRRHQKPQLERWVYLKSFALGGWL